MRIIIVEDQLMFREAIRKACVRELGHQVIGEAESGTVGVALVTKYQPDVLLLDLSLPELDGFSVIERVKQSAPATKIIVISAYLDDYTVLNVDKAAIHGYIDKNTNQIQTLATALSAVEKGQRYFSPAYESLRKSLLADSSWFAKLLSRTELKVLELVGRGLDNSEIGCELGISPRTAQAHRTSILQKLKLRGTPKLMIFALERGFINRLSVRFSRKDKKTKNPS